MGGGDDGRMGRVMSRHFVVLSNFAVPLFGSTGITQSYVAVRKGLMENPKFTQQM